MYKVISVILIWSCLGISDLYSQTILSGEVHDIVGTPIMGAHVIIYDEHESILSFTFTDSLGEFSLEQAINDYGLFIKVSHLSYLSVEMPLIDQDEFIYVTLESGEHELPEVIVKVDPIIRRGDTLIFDVNSYTQHVDRTFEDVLARLPGIEIEPNGTILYRGLPISKFYIEGLDMLEGRYKIATQNLGLHHIRDVEIIERHQHKKVLQDLEHTNQAAINVRLKSKVAVTGSVSAGIASGDPDYSMRGDIFGFAKPYQFVGLTSINTFGLSEGASFADLLQDYSLYDLPTLSVNGPRRPWQIPSSVYTQNDEQVLGGMGLIKLGVEEVIKLRTTYTRDIFSFAGSEDIRFDLPGVPTLTQQYSYQNELSPVSWSSHAIYEKNGDHLFIKSKNVIKASHNTDLGKNTYNGTPITENLSNKTFEGKSANEIIFRLPNQALSVYVDLLYKNLNESLDVDTLDLAIDNINKGFSELNQTMDRSIVQGHIWTGFHWKTNKGVLFAKTGIESITDDMTSLLMSDGANISLGPAYRNDQSFRQLSAYTDYSYRHKFGRRELTIGLPLRWLVYSLKDKVRNNEAAARPFLYSLTTRYFDQSSAYFNWSVDYTYRDDVAPLTRPIHTGFILYSNRSLGRSILNLNRLNEHKATANMTYVHSSVNKTYSLGSEYTSGIYQLLNVEQFDLSGRNDIQVDQRNNQKRLKLYANSRGGLSQKLDYILKGQIFWSERLIGSNGQLLSLSNSSSMLELSLIYLIGQSVLTFNPQWFFLNSSTASAKASQSIYRLKYYAHFSDWGALRIEGGAYASTVGGDLNWNSLFNLEWEKEWKKSRTTLSLEINNITQENDFISVEQSLNSQRFFSLGLRPLQVRLRCKKSW